MKAKSGKTRLTNEEMNGWVTKLQQQEADPELQEAFVEHFRGLVESIARRYAKGKGSHEDLVQVGMIGLLGALKRYDASFGQPFEGFAIPTIVGEMKRYIRDKTWDVHVPRRIKELGPRIKKAVDTLTREWQRSPKIDEIAVYLDVSQEEVLETMEMGRSYRTLSVNSELEMDGDGNTVTLLDLIGESEKGYDEIEQGLFLKNVVRVLTDREQQIIRLLFYENLSQKQVGEKLGISQMHVSRLQRRALSKLKESLRPNESECI